MPAVQEWGRWEGLDRARAAAEEDRHPFLFVSAGGFKESFHAVCGEYPDRPLLTWTLEDLF